MIEKGNSNVKAVVFASIQRCHVRAVTLKARNLWLRELCVDRFSKLFNHLKPTAELCVDLFTHRLETSDGCVDRIVGVNSVSILFLKFCYLTDKRPILF